jgi:hypothetical protein
MRMNGRQPVPEANQMTNWSFDHVAEMRAALSAIVNDPAYGSTALSNVRIMSEVLPGLLRGARLERSVLVTAARENLASTMLDHVSGGMDPGLAVRISAHFLVRISPVPLAACYRVAAELALALGLISAEEADQLASGALDEFASRDAEIIVGPAEGSVDDAPAPPAQPGKAGPSQPPPPDKEETMAPPSWAAPPPAGPPPSPPAYGQPFPAQPVQILGQSPAHNQPTQLAPLAGEWISHVVRDTVHPGLLAFNPPSEMHQGHSERVEVGIARSPELRDALTAGFRGRGLPEVVHVDASPQMGVELRGSSFAIEALSAAEQLVVPLARWEFDVTPLRSGSQTLTLCVTIRIESPYVSGGRIAIPVFERDIRIKVDVVYGARRFVANNWQWLVGTAVGLGGGIAAWISLVH